MAAPKTRLTLYGWHACRAALLNPKRRVHEVWLCNPEDRAALPPLKGISLRMVDRLALDRKVQGGVHQGILCEVDPLPPVPLSFLEDQAGCVVCLDQVTDPQNVGAILRSSAAFGAAAVVVPDTHAPHESGALVKAASGAYECVPMIRVTNLKTALVDLKTMGYWVLGFDEQATQTLKETPLEGKTAFVFGSEGKGIRPLIQTYLDAKVLLPTHNSFCTLNVATAASIVLYEAFVAGR